MPEEKFIKQFLGNTGDEIDAPTPAQAILFNKKRFRNPALIDVHKPLGIGVNHDAEIGLKLEAVRHPFLNKHLSEIIEKTFSEFEAFSGRHYSSVNFYKTEDAHYLIAANGPMVNQLIAFADWARDKQDIKLGIINLSLASPFDGAELTHHIKKKSAVTILQNLSDHFFNTPLMDLTHNAINLAWENGRHQKDKLPHLGFAIYTHTKDQPEIYNGFYATSFNAIEEIYTIVENMLPEGNHKKLFYCGLNLSVNQARFPKLEALQQLIKKSYPEIEELALSKKNGSFNLSEENTHKIQVYASLAQDIKELGHPLAAAVKKSGFFHTETLLSEQKSAMMPLHKFTLFFSGEESITPFTLKKTDVMLLSELQFKNNLNDLSDNGTLVINTHFEGAKLWEELGEKERQIIRDKKIRLFSINTQEIAREIDIIPAGTEHLKLCALLGGLYKTDAILSILKFGVHLNNFKKILKTTGLFDSQINEKTNAIKRGYNLTSEIEWQKLPEFSGLKVPETEAPWHVKQVRNADGSIFDLARSWDSVGYLYNNNLQVQELADPFLASNTLPARSSAFRDMSEMKEKIPEIIAEKCTGCGMCWSQCPDSALPVHFMGVDEIITTAMNNAAAHGSKLIQMQRMAGNFAKQAYTLFSTDEMRRFLTTQNLLSEAFNHLVKKMGLKGNALQKVESEFKIFLEEVQEMPLIKTTTFFDLPHKSQKGTGKILTITVNANACKGCGSCANVCPDDAIEMLDNNADILTSYRKNFAFMQSMPDVSAEQIEPFISTQNQKSLVNKLINKKAYFTLPGGDNAYPGSGVKAAVHLMTASIEAKMNDRISAFVTRISLLIEQLEARIQGDIQDSVQINEFEAFSDRLAGLDETEITAQKLIDLTNPKESKSKLNTQLIKKLSRLTKGLIALKNEYISGAHGNGSARMSMVVNSKRLLAWSAVYPFNPFSHPWINASGNDLATTAQGIFDGLTYKLAESFKLVRIAELELKNTYSAREHDAFFNTFGWDDFSDEERKLCPPAVLLLDQQALEQQSFKSISSLLNTEKPLYISVVNNMVGTTSEIGHEIALWALSQHNSFVLQSSPANPGHLINGLEELLESNKPGFVHLYACEPYIQGLEKDQAYTHEQRAINSRVFPLFKYNPFISDYFIERFDLSGNPEIESDWTSAQPIQSSNNGTRMVSTTADWAINEKFYRDEFHALAKREWNEKMVPLDEFLEIDISEQKDFIPFINVTDSKNTTHRVQVSTKIARLAQKHLRTWNLLQELAGIRIHDREYQEQKFNKMLESELSLQKTNLEQEYNAQIMQVQQEHWQTYHGRLRDKLTELYKAKNDKERINSTLAEYAKNKGR